MDPGAAGVAGGDGASSILLEVVEKTADEHRVEIREVELGGLLAGLRLDVGKEQLEGVTVGVDGVRAGVALSAELADEERLQRRGERDHRAASLAVSTSALASANSSGTPVKYRYVEAGSTWPSWAESAGNSAWTS